MMQELEPVEEREEFYCRYAETPYRVSSQLKLDTLEPNCQLVTVAISRNVPISKITDGLRYLELPTDQAPQRFTLVAITPKTTEWLLTLATMADYNQPATQSHKPNTPADLEEPIFL